MQKIDPQMASRVWGRVQACQPREEKPPETIRVIKTPPEAWEGECKKEKSICRKQPCTQPIWFWLVILWVLCSGKIC